MAFLTKRQARSQAERLADHIRKYGVKVDIDLRTGAGGNHWGVDTFIAPMAHHIVSRKSQGRTPFYSLVRKGRVDVPGPLCNVYGGWDRVARIVTMGLANHPGRGGPWIISGRRIPRDNGRYYFMGTEFEGGMRESDWDDDYRQFMGGVNAGKLDYLAELSGLDLRDTALTEHSMWARPKGRKIDRLNYTHEKSIAEMQAARRNSSISPKDEADMPLNGEDLTQIRDLIREEVGYAAWSYENKRLSGNQDAYGILREIASLVEKNNHALGRIDLGADTSHREQFNLLKTATERSDPGKGKDLLTEISRLLEQHSGKDTSDTSSTTITEH